MYIFYPPRSHLGHNIFEARLTSFVEVKATPERYYRVKATFGHECQKCQIVECFSHPTPRPTATDGAFMSIVIIRGLRPPNDMLHSMLSTPRTNVYGFCIYIVNIVH